LKNDAECNNYSRYAKLGVLTGTGGIMVNHKSYFTSALICLSLVFTACSKQIPTTFGNIEETYSCVGILPLTNETSFVPLNELLTGYFNLEMYNAGFDEVLAPSDFDKVYREQGKVYYPKRFNRPLAIEYSTLLGLDGVLYGNLSSPDRVGSDVKGKKKLLNLELYFIDVNSRSVVWSYNERTYITPGQYNAQMRLVSKDVVAKLKNSGFRYARKGNPCYDSTLAQKLERLPSLSREMFNSLSQEIAETSEENLWLNLGNVYMSVGRRDLAIVEYQKFLKQNPASPFKNEVERQVAIIERTGSTIR